MIIKKYGYVARVLDNDALYTIPSKAPQIKEAGIYPYFWIIEKKRAEQFIRINDDVVDFQNMARIVIFGETIWRKIVESFGGYEPEAILIDTPPSIAQIFTYKLTPENLKIKLRVMLDENEKQIKESDILSMRNDFG